MSTSLQADVRVTVVAIGRKTVTLSVDGRSYVLQAGDDIVLHTSLRVGS